MLIQIETTIYLDRCFGWANVSVLSTEQALALERCPRESLAEERPGGSNDFPAWGSQKRGNWMSRLPFFPAPESGEPIHSGICRCARRSGIGATDLLLDLVGRQGRTALLGMLPTRLKQLTHRLPEGHPWTDIRYTILSHTSLPFLTYFCGTDAKDTAIKLLSSAERASSAYSFLGLPQYPTSDWRRVYLWCPDCIGEDVERIGFAIYHREHQVPGVLVCWKHHCALSHGCKICGPSPPPGGSFAMPGECSCGIRVSPLPVAEASKQAMEGLIWFAEQSAYILSSQWTHSCPRRVLASTLNLPKFCRGDDPAYRKIAIGLQQRYGPECLNLLGYPAFESGGEPSLWVRGSLRGSREERRTPTPGLLLLLGLGVDSADRFESAARGEDARNNYPVGSPIRPPEPDVIEANPPNETVRGPFKKRFGQDTDRSEVDRQLADAIRRRARELRTSPNALCERTARR